MESQSHTVQLFECFSQNDPRYSCSSCDEEVGQLGLEAASEPVSWRSRSRTPSLPHWLAVCSQWPKVQGIKTSLLVNSCQQTSMQSKSKQKQRGFVLTADLSAAAESVCSLPRAHVSHEVIGIVTVLKTACNEKAFREFIR
ncbi:unnamed protein product [Pleuronectes platessa]|uniref:Uncharacterized protein n=1 Tax=Pleuronectes platessa TaxID=8262 RepID=A0A9N7YMF4_PLEPL|nr:unnamed protein product [Pleuronectes platessa]